MSLKEAKTEVKKVGDNLVIPLPADFCEGTELKDGCELKIVYTKRGHFEVRVTKLEEGEIKCQICGKRKGKHICSNCGIQACSNCFWEWGNMCHNCIKNK